MRRLYQSFSAGFSGAMFIDGFGARDIAAHRPSIDDSLWEASLPASIVF